MYWAGMKMVRVFILLVFSFAYFLEISAQEKVYPKNGDGIMSLLRRHNRGSVDHHKQFLELNKSKLGKGNNLIMGVAYALPPITLSSSKVDEKPTSPSSKGTGVKKREPLFGPKLSEYEIISSDLKGATFYLVSGHGGPDPGATARFENHTLHEDEYAYDIMLRLARNLMMHGATVHIIIQDAVDGIRDGRLLANSKRETCMGAKIPRGQVDRLEQRTDKINSLHRKVGNGYARAIFIHIDSRSKHKQLDVFFYHSSSDASKRLARTMKNTFQKKYDRHQPGRGFTGTVSERNLYVLRNTTPVALYAELANIQNASDLRRIIQKDNRQALANWMCEGFMADYKLFKNN